ncbi:MAG: transposase [Hyphomicrobiaceae bacterium]|nr:transposase [Hyphomicrobiaceae bacterium]
MAKIERRQHSDAYKRRLVARVLKGSKSVEEISEIEGLSPSMLHNWKRDARFGGDPMRFPSSRNALGRLPQKAAKAAPNGVRATSDKRWKFCPNCGERLK